jgi:glutamyl-tRNA synthetase
MSLFNLAFVRQQGGQFILRIEDTDRGRYVEDSERQIFETLHWLGLDWDEGPDKGGPFAPYRQSERLDTYQPFIDQLLAAGNAYYCWCSPARLTEMREAQQKAKQPTGYDRLCYGKTREERAELPGFSEIPVIRMFIPDDVELTFVDLIRGETSAPRPDDQVIVKGDGFPTYHLAVVVDDHLMGITHVVRGEEWISSTPKHILLYRWLGLTPPAFAHMPLLRNTDKSKISKRKNPAARLLWFREQGYLPEALRNFLALMGYSMPDGREVFSLDDMIENFDWARVNPVGPVFDIDKLNWLNGQYLRALSAAELAAQLLPVLQTAGVIADPASSDQVALLAAATPLVHERMALLSEAIDLLGFLFIDDALFEIDPAAAAKVLGADARPTLEAALSALASVEPWSHEPIKAALDDALVAGLGLKPRNAFGPLRVAITGRTISPPLFESMELLGREVSMRRLASALAELPA